MNPNLDTLASLALDLKRASLGLHRGSNTMAQQFEKEIIKRTNEINLKDLDPYIRELVQKMKIALENSDCSKKAEELLMYSILFQNYFRKKIEVR